MHLHNERRKSSDYDHPHYLNPSPDPHNLKHSLRFSESNSSLVRETGMMMAMAPPMLSVGVGSASLD
jgi:hypothetical protein